MPVLAVVGEVLVVPVVRVEVRDLLRGARPEEDVVLRVGEVVGEAATKVACPHYAGAHLFLWRLR